MPRFKRMPRRSSRAAFFFAPLCLARSGQFAVVKEAKVTSKPVVEVDFVELSDGTLLETIEDPNDPARTLLAVYRDKTTHYADQFETDDRI